MVIQINRSNQIWDDTIMLWGSVGWMEKVEDKNMIVKDGSFP